MFNIFKTIKDIFKNKKRFDKHCKKTEVPAIRMKIRTKLKDKFVKSHKGCFGSCKYKRTFA